MMEIVGKCAFAMILKVVFFYARVISTDEILICIHSEYTRRFTILWWRICITTCIYNYKQGT